MSSNTTSNMGPSNMLPRDPPVLGEAKDATVVCEPGKLPRVTALALAPVDDEKIPALYSGYEDGTLRR